MFKIFSIDELCLTEDLAQLQKFLDERSSNDETIDDHVTDPDAINGTVSDDNYENIDFKA